MSENHHHSLIHAQKDICGIIYLEIPLISANPGASRCWQRMGMAVGLSERDKNIPI